MAKTRSKKPSEDKLSPKAREIAEGVQRDRNIRDMILAQGKQALGGRHLRSETVAALIDAAKHLLGDDWALAPRKRKLPAKAATAALGRLADAFGRVAATHRGVLAGHAAARYWATQRKAISDHPGPHGQRA